MEIETTLSGEDVALEPAFDELAIEGSTEPDLEAVVVESELLPAAVESEPSPIVEWQRSRHRERHHARSHAWRGHGWQGWRMHLERRKRKARRLRSEVSRIADSFYAAQRREQLGAGSVALDPDQSAWP